MNFLSKQVKKDKSMKEIINKYRSFIALVYSEKKYELYYEQISKKIQNMFGDDIHKKLKSQVFKKIDDLILCRRQDCLTQMHLLIEEKALSGVNDNEKVIIFFILTLINNFFYEDVIKNSERYDFVFDFPVDIIFMASISDFSPIILSFMDRNNDDFLDFNEGVILSENDEIEEEEEEEDEFKKRFSYLNKNDNESIIRFEEEIGKLLEIKFNYYTQELMNIVLEQILIPMKYRDLIDIAYTCYPDEDNFLLTTYFLKKFINDESYRSVGVHDMIEFSNQLYQDFKLLTFENNSNQSKFFENAFQKLSDYFSQITEKGYSPFLSSAIFETVNKLKKVIPKGNIRTKFKESMSTILKITNDVKMASDQQNVSLPYYFLDLSGTPLHKLMELNPKTIIPFTLSPYLLKKELPNIEVLRQTKEKSKKCQPEFDPKLFSCSPTANSTIAVIRDIFVEYDSISERLVNSGPVNLNVYEEKQSSPLPGMLIFKLSMLQWDFMPNFARDMNFVPVFQVPYNSINKLAIKNFIDTNHKTDVKTFYLDLHTADCNLCFYPLTETESNAIKNFFKDQIRIEMYENEKLKQHFLEKTKSEMTQAACNYIPTMIDSLKNMHPNEDNKSDPYYILFKDFSNVGKRETPELEDIVTQLCHDDAPILLLESVCYVCQKEPQTASRFIECLEGKLKTANKQMKTRILTIIDRFIDPAILQNELGLIDKAKNLIDTIHFLFGDDKELINPNDLSKKIMGIAKGSHFFSLTTEDINDRIDFDTVHREWLMRSIPDDNDNDDDDE